MELVDLTPITAASLPTDAFKSHLQLGTGFSASNIQDEVLEAFLFAAVSAIEGRIGKYLFKRTASWTITRWTREDAQVLPVAPVSAIAAVLIADANGGLIAQDVEAFVLLKDKHRPVVKPKAGLFPTIPSAGTAQITFEAGFGTGWEEIPSDLRQAVFLLAAHYYENRNESGPSTKALPFGVTTLLEPYRPVRTMGSGL